MNKISHIEFPIAHLEVETLVSVSDDEVEHAKPGRVRGGGAVVEIVRHAHYIWKEQHMF